VSTDRIGPGAATAITARPRRIGRLIARHLSVLALYVLLAVVTLADHRNVLVLNWIVGPLFPFIVLYAIPECAKCIARRVGPP
jgi:hypothetical protein